MANLVILHTSDAHFGISDPNDEQRRITGALVEAARSSNLKPDLCVFSGDLAHSGKLEQFQMGEVWLDSLLSNWECPLIVLPGNHDVDRNKADTVLLRTSYPLSNTFSLQRDNLAKESGHEHFQPFLDWHKTLAAAHKRVRTNWEESVFACSTSLEAEECQLKVICLNTALLSCGNDDARKLAVDLRSVNALLGDGKGSAEVLVLVVGHHPIDGEWLVEWNDSELRTLLSQATGAHAYLSGHTHIPRGEAFTRSTGGTLAPLQAGAAYQGSDWLQSFAFYEFDLNDSQIIPHTFTYHHEAGKWVRDEKASFPLTARLPRKPKKIAVKRGHAELIAEKSGELVEMTRIFISRIEDSSDQIYALHWEGDALQQGTVAFQGQAVAIGAWRIVVHSSSNIAALVAHLLSLARGDALASPDVINCQIRSVWVHGSTQDAHLFQMVKQMIRDAGLPLKPYINMQESSEERRVVQLEALVQFKEPELPPFQLGFEIQSALEAFWEATQNRLRRRVATDGALGGHLRAIRAFLDGCEHYLDTLGKNPGRVSESGLIEDTALKGSIEGPATAMQRYGRKGIPNHIFERVLSAHNTLDEAESSVNQPDRSQKFAQAAAAFQKARETAATFVDANSEAARQLDYWLQMELAYCLLRTGAEDDLAQAEKNYRNLEREHPDDAVVKYRLGQVYRRLRNYEVSIKSFEDALTILKRNGDPLISSNHWLHVSLRHDLAYTYWRWGQDDPTSLGAGHPQDCLARAIELEREILSGKLPPGELPKETYLKHVNDLVYYGWEERKDRTAGRVPALRDEEYRRLALELAEGFDIANMTDFFPLDTLCRVLYDLSERDTALVAARRLVEVIHQSADRREILDRDRADSLLFASRLLAEGGG
jgi:tetratricopeptide (TPR) repeat protein/predicted phosphodiesterase